MTILFRFGFGPTAMILLVFCASIGVYGGDTPDWTLSPSIGVYWGLANEIVYDTSGIENQNDYLSLLSWELQPAVIVGFQAVRTSPKHNRLHIALGSAVPGLRSGEMNDYDWLYTDRDWSHWSESDVWLRWGFVLDIAHDWRVVKRETFRFGLGVAYHLDWWAWRDKTGDSLYSSLNIPQTSYPVPFPLGDGFRDDPGAVEAGVSGIDYSAAYHSLLGVLSFDWAGPVLFLNLTGRIGPVLAFSHDHHKLRDDLGPDGGHFYDSAFGGPWVDIALTAGFRTQGRFSFSLRGDFAWLNETRGSSVYVYTDGAPSQIAEDSAGFSFHRVGVSALFSWAVDARP